MKSVLKIWPASDVPFHWERLLPESRRLKYSYTVSLSCGTRIQYGFYLEVCQAGCDYIDVGMEPLSWGTGHADLISVQAMLKDAGFKVPEINMEAYMKVRSMIQEFMDDFLGLYISPKTV